MSQPYPPDPSVSREVLPASTAPPAGRARETAALLVLVGVAVAMLAGVAGFFSAGVRIGSLEFAEWFAGPIVALLIGVALALATTPAPGARARTVGTFAVVLVIVGVLIGLVLGLIAIGSGGIGDGFAQFLRLIATMLTMAAIVVYGRSVLGSVPGVPILGPKAAGQIPSYPQPQYGQPQYGPQYGQPQYGPQYSQPQYGQSSGQPQYGQSYGHPQYGPQYSQPQYGQPQYAQPQYGQQQYAPQPAPTQLDYDQRYGSPTAEQPAEQAEGPPRPTRASHGATAMPAASTSAATSASTSAPGSAGVAAPGADDSGANHPFARPPGLPQQTGASPDSTGERQAEQPSSEPTGAHAESGSGSTAEAEPGANERGERGWWQEPPRG